MEIIFFVAIVYGAFCGLLVLFQIIFYVAGKGNLSSGFAFRFFEIWVLVILPWLFLLVFDIVEENDCCSESAIFSPAHRATIYTLLIVCTAAYFYQSHKKKIYNVTLELISSCLIIIGIVLNIFIGIQLGRSFIVLSLFGNIPIVLLAVYVLNRNHEILILYAQNGALHQNNKYERWLALLMQKKEMTLYPILSFLCIPLLLFIILILLVFGQQPDAIVRAFTDTYKHGFSQLDYLCDNVQCGGHYLCSVAAKGHKKVVKPMRLGKRNGALIMCNRQLLVSNAFEEWLQQAFPSFHLIVRRRYNKVGDVIHKYYGVFENPWVCDIIYVMMKPAEWLFVLVLYVCDEKPENRIARQYVERKMLA